MSHLGDQQAYYDDDDHCHDEEMEIVHPDSEELRLMCGQPERSSSDLKCVECRCHNEVDTDRGYRQEVGLEPQRYHAEDSSERSGYYHRHDQRYRERDLIRREYSRSVSSDTEECRDTHHRLSRVSCNDIQRKRQKCENGSCC